MEELYSEVEVVIHGGSIIENKCCYTWKKFNQEWRLLLMEEVYSGVEVAIH